ncbi:MAG: hypothetical protein ACOC1P_01215 [Minisyncoccales bacterium]
MRRFSHYLTEEAGKLDAIAGKYFTKINDSIRRNRLRDVPKEMFLLQAMNFSEGLGKALETLVAKPVYYIENFFIGESTYLHKDDYKKH